MENIAVVGIANLFPGSSAPEDFWQKLLEKQDCRSKATAKQMGVAPEKYTGKKGDTDKFYCVHGGYINDFAFDKTPFVETSFAKTNSLTADYLNGLDDLNQWALYVTHKALENAGYWQSEKLANCGVILGNLSFPTKSSNHLFMPLYHQAVEQGLAQGLNADFQLAHFVDDQRAKQNIHPDNALVAGYPSALLAKAAGLGGTHFSLDAACASSCYSVKLACDYLHTGKADMMLAGAVSGSDPLFVNMGFSIFQAYPENNVHAPFDSTSQGLFAGEGAGMMVLKRNSDAVRDGDNILAVIRGGALSNDGKGEFVLSPNTKGQVLVYERAYQDAGVSPSDVDYIECHATGTPKGDKVELGSMETFFSKHQAKPLLGSVKSNLGHLLTAAGMPGMTKAIWALNQQQIPATINLNQPIRSKDGYFTGEQIPTEITPWPTKANHVPTAGVSVFGFGGSNAHLVLQGANTPVDAQGAKLNQQAQQLAKQPLSIVGIDAHFGSADDLAAFEQLVLNKQSNFVPLPKNRWKGIEQNSQVMAALNLPQAPLGGYVDSFDIDFLQFKIPPNEQDSLIPQQLMMMKVADNAAKDAQLQEGANVAVIVAMGLELELHQYRGRVNLATQIEQSLIEQGVSLTAEQQQTLTNIAKDGVASAAQLNQYTSFIGNIMASRISALWDFSGPAFTVSAEENSAYRCVELAQNLFATSDVDAVIIAGVDLAGSVENICLRQHYGNVDLTPNNAIAIDTNTDTDDSRWKVGEGAAAFVLKPSQQVSQHASYAQIDALAFSNGVNQTSQSSVIDSALSQVQISSEQVSVVEKHGSGFALEDDIENVTLPRFYADEIISSVKQQIGHTFNASGMASIITSALKLNNASTTSVGKTLYGAVNGLGKDEAICHLILSSTDTRAVQSINANNTTQSTVRTKPKLIKTITLGGKDICQSIVSELHKTEQLNAEQDHHLSAMFQESTLSKITNRTDTKQLMRKLVPIEKNVTVATKQSAETGVSTIQVAANATVQSYEKALSNGANVTNNISANAVDFPQLNATHQAFLKQRNSAQQQISQLLDLQLALESDEQVARQPVSTVETLKPNLDTLNAPSANILPTNSSAPGFAIKGPAGYQYPPLDIKQQYSRPSNIVWDTEDLVEFAEGDIAKVFGDEYKVIDSYSRRVRLPTTDYLLVSRVTALDAEVNDYRKSTMVTEYDIPVDAPFLIDGQIPWSVAVESGQCDLLLISYIGIDFQAKGERVYRLLDCELTFLEEMAFGGETLRYEIQIDSYAKNGEQLLFFFHYDCYVGDKKVLIMRNGCAGFFTDDELADGKGVILNDKDKAELANAKKSSFPALLTPEVAREKYDHQAMMKLVGGDVAACFGNNYDQQGRNPSLKFSSEKFLMIERITKVERNGGHWGLGIIEGQKDLAPEHWYFPCHFKDDQVMAGSLMSEGCGQLAMFYMLSLGMHSYVNNARFQPMPGEAQTVRCRGQVTPQTNTLTYRMEVTALGMEPQPFLKANITIILDGKPVVDFKNLSVMIVEQDDNSPYPVTLPDNVKLFDGKNTQTKTLSKLLDERGVEAFKLLEKPLMWVSSDESAKAIKGVMPIKHVPAPEVAGQNRVPDHVPFTPWHMFEFATGNISNCFGKEFDIYQGRIPPRTPCGDLQLVTQVVDVQGERLDLKKPSSCTAEYYVPIDAWYFDKNSHENWMPYSILMEIALQPNGFISGYMGATLKYPEKDLFFRNLDGSGELLKQVDLRGKTIVNKSVMLSTSMAGGAIIQNFTFELFIKAQSSGEQDELFYKGTAVFGYFSADSLTNQLGIDNGKVTQPWFVNQQTPTSNIEKIDLRDKSLAYYQAPVNKPHYKLAGGQLNFIDHVSVVEGGGDHQIAYLLGERTIDARDWFFRYHFHQDPVMPGSLGVEAIIELLQTYALKNDLGASFTNPRFIAPKTQVNWKYRGQITPENKQMSLDVHIKAIEHLAGEVRIIGDANLSKDGLRIYQVSDIVLSIVEA